MKTAGQDGGNVSKEATTHTCYQTPIYVHRADPKSSLSACPICLWDAEMASKKTIAELTETIRILSNSDAVRSIAAGLEDVKAGRTKPIEQVRAELDGKLDWCANCEVLKAQLAVKDEEHLKEKLTIDKAIALAISEDFCEHHTQTIDVLTANCGALREAVAWCYQMAGANNAPVWVLDNLSALASGEKAPHEWKAV